jgi:hypothetical protein
MSRAPSPSQGGFTQISATSGPNVVAHAINALIDEVRKINGHINALNGITSTLEQGIDNNVADILAIQNQTAQIAPLHQLMNAVSQSLTNLGATPSTTASTTTPGYKLKMHPPEEFSGDVDKFDEFKSQCTLYINHTSPQATTEQKITYIMGYCKGPAYVWMQPGIDVDTARRGATNWLHNMDEFWNKMQARFGDVHKID